MYRLIITKDNRPIGRYECSTLAECNRIREELMQSYPDFNTFSTEIRHIGDSYNDQ